jgi:hypothetical protein
MIYILYSSKTKLFQIKFKMGISILTDLWAYYSQILHQLYVLVVMDMKCNAAHNLLMIFLLHWINYQFFFQFKDIKNCIQSSYHDYFSGNGLDKFCEVQDKWIAHFVFQNFPKNECDNHYFNFNCKRNVHSVSFFYMYR